MSLAVLAFAAVAAAESVQAASDAGRLFPRDYFSTTVRENGEALPLFAGTKIHVDFWRRDGSAVVRWSADCNAFGADVDITDTRLVTGQLESTAVGCRGVPLRQDRWMARFFRADPKWRLREDGRLKLRAGDRVIKLRQKERRG